MRVDLSDGLAIGLVVSGFLGGMAGGYYLGDNSATKRAKQEFPAQYEERLRVHHMALRRMMGKSFHMYVTDEGRASYSNPCPVPEDDWEWDGKIGRDEL